MMRTKCIAIAVALAFGSAGVLAQAPATDAGKDAPKGPPPGVEKTTGKGAVKDGKGPERKGPMKGDPGKAAPKGPRSGPMQGGAGPKE